MIQNILSTLIVIFAFSFTAWRSYKIITKKPSSKGKCEGCDGCALKAKIDCAAPEIYKG
jgi:hypothetical protein